MFKAKHVLILVFAAFIASSVMAADLITWGLVNFDPRNTSRTDLARELIQDRLKHYEHSTVAAPIPRIVNEIKSGTHWCWAGALKTEERESFSWMSMPFIFTFPQRIIVRKERRAEFMARSPLSLEALLRDKSLRTSVARSRAYSPAIDELLKRHPPAQATSSIPEAIQMLLADRLDYVLEDVGVANAHAQQLGRDAAFVALSFKEAPDYVLGRVMCPKTDWGRKVIQEINAVLRAERGSARYRSIVETYHGDEDVRLLRSVYDDVFLKSE